MLPKRTSLLDKKDFELLILLFVQQYACAFFHFKFSNFTVMLPNIMDATGETIS